MPSAGDVVFNGTSLLPLKMHERAQLGLTLAWQEPARFEGITVCEYLSVGKPRCDPAEALKQVGFDPERYLNRRVDKALSGRERHRIELASVLTLAFPHGAEWRCDFSKAAVTSSFLRRRSPDATFRSNASDERGFPLVPASRCDSSMA